MGSVYYDISILIKDEAIASNLSEKLITNQEECDFELIRLVNKSLNTNIEPNGLEYSIDSLRSFTNEIEIKCYSGRSSDPPLGIIGVLAEHGATIVKIAELHDESIRPTNRCFVDGQKATKNEYTKQFNKYKIEDDTEKLQKYLSNHNFQNASKIIDDCELGRIEPDDGYLFSLITSRKYDSLVRKLLQAGLYGNRPWLINVSMYGTTELLKSFVDYGFDPYDIEQGQTALHSCLNGSCESSLSNTKYLIKLCSNDLNVTTEEGSPLWNGFVAQANIPGCLLFEEAGAKVIPPSGFYDSKDGVNILVESIIHRDMTTFKEHYEDRFYDLSLYWALRYQSFSIVTCLNQEKSIDWHSPITRAKCSDFSFGEFDDYYLAKPSYEIPFILNDGNNCDSRLLDFIIENIQPCNKTYNKMANYISGYKYLPESVLLLNKLKDHGAQFDVALKNTDGDKESALYRAVMNGCIENLDYLLEIGATIPNARKLGIESLEKFVKEFVYGDKRKKALAILKKHGQAKCKKALKSSLLF